MADDLDEFLNEHADEGQLSQESLPKFVELLWKLYADAVFALAYAELHDADVAGEVTSETFARALRWVHKPEYQIPSNSNFKAWLRTIAKNLIIDIFRKKKPAQWAPDHGSNEPLNALENTPDLKTLQPCDNLIRQETLDILRHCLDLLPPRLSELLQLRHIKQLTYRQIAKNLSMNVNHVGVTLHRTHKRLRECVELQTDSPQ